MSDEHDLVFTSNRGANTVAASVGPLRIGAAEVRAHLDELDALLKQGSTRAICRMLHDADDTLH